MTTQGPEANEAVLIWNEFAEVRVSIDTTGLTPRLFLENLETGNTAFIDPLELAMFIDTPEELRVRWLEVGAYFSA